MKTVFLMCVVAIASGCHGAGPAQGKDGQDRGRAIRVSGSDCPQGVGPTQIVRLEALVANARAYEGRRVSVTGYYTKVLSTPPSTRLPVEIHLPGHPLRASG